MLKLSKNILLFFSFLFILAPVVFAEDFTITTYYPSPYGSYRQLAVTGQDDAINAGGSNVGSIDISHTTAGSLSAITFKSTTNWPSDGGYLAYYDDNNSYNYWGDSAENSALVLGVTNDGQNAASDVVVLKSPAAAVIDAPSLLIPAGNVGIGVTSASQALQVNGHIKMSGSRTVLFTQGDNNTTHVGGVQFLTYNNGTNFVWTPTNASGGTVNSTVSLGGGGAFNNNTINLTVTGNLSVAGTLTKGSGSFLIDHPLDPLNKVLRHSFVESPDMKNVYDGVVILGKGGEYTVKLPSYFQTLNRDFRYQLTPIGESAGLYVKKEIENNEFVIAGGKEGLKVCWQVTGSRKDPYAVKHPIIVEEEKGKSSGTEKGKYIHADSYGEVKEEAKSKS